MTTQLGSHLTTPAHSSNPKLTALPRVRGTDGDLTVSTAGPGGVLAHFHLQGNKFNQQEGFAKFHDLCHHFSTHHIFCLHFSLPFGLRTYNVEAGSSGRHHAELTLAGGLGPGSFISPWATFHLRTLLSPALHCLPPSLSTPYPGASPQPLPLSKADSSSFPGSQLSHRLPLGCPP